MMSDTVVKQELNRCSAPVTADDFIPAAFQRANDQIVLDTALTEMGATAAVTQNQSDLSDCDFIIIPEKIYEPMTFNGEPLTEPYLTHARLARGGTLAFVMTDRPSA